MDQAVDKPVTVAPATPLTESVFTEIINDAEQLLD